MSINRKLSKLANIIDDATQNQYLVADGSGELVFGDLTVSLIDGTNTTITKSTDPVTTLRFDTDSGFDLDDLGGGAVKIKMNSTFKSFVLKIESVSRVTYTAVSQKYIHMLF